MKDPIKKSIQQIKNSLSLIKVQSDAPVDSWNPKFCGDLDIRITKDGSWFYEGSKINRKNLVKLFSSILKKEGEKYFLVTPSEKIGIKAITLPFTVGGDEKSNDLFELFDQSIALIKEATHGHHH